MRTEELQAVNDQLVTLTHAACISDAENAAMTFCIPLAVARIIAGMPLDKLKLMASHMRILFHPCMLASDKWRMVAAMQSNDLGSLFN